MKDSKESNRILNLNQEKEGCKVEVFQSPDGNSNSKAEQSPHQALSQELRQTLKVLSPIHTVVIDLDALNLNTDAKTDENLDNFVLGKENKLSSGINNN